MPALPVCHGSISDKGHISENTSESIREYNHMGERAYIVTQSIKKLKKEEKEWALNPQGFKRVSDDTPVDITKLSEDDKGLCLDEVTFSPKDI